MDLGEFRERAKQAGLAVNQREYTGPLFVFMFMSRNCGALALPAGEASLRLLLDFAKREEFGLFTDIKWHHASRRELDACYSPLIWQPYDPRPVDAIVVSVPKAPEGRVFLKEWFENFAD
jgi:hypothetical protein